MITLKQLTPDEVQHVQKLIDKSKKFLDFVENTLKASDEDFAIMLRVLGFCADEIEAGRATDQKSLTRELTSYLVHEVFQLRDRKQEGSGEN